MWAQSEISNHLLQKPWFAVRFYPWKDEHTRPLCAKEWRRRREKYPNFWDNSQPSHKFKLMTTKSHHSPNRDQSRPVRHWCSGWNQGKGGETAPKTNLVALQTRKGCLCTGDQRTARRSQLWVCLHIDILRQLTVFLISTNTLHTLLADCKLNRQTKRIIDAASLFINS